MSAIGPGDWVECVNNVGVEKLMTGGAIYCVDAIVPAFGNCRRCGEQMDAGVHFIGSPIKMAKPGFPYSFHFCRFRPIYRPKADLIESLKTPAKREGVPA